MVFPELCLSPYAIDDLLFQDEAFDQMARQIDRLSGASRDFFPVFVVGASLRSGDILATGLRSKFTEDGVNCDWHIRTA
jgi:NAD+ synthase (glutamine-hydrolysing)